MVAYTLLKYLVNNNRVSPEFYLFLNEVTQNDHDPLTIQNHVTIYGKLDGIYDIYLVVVENYSMSFIERGLPVMQYCTHCIIPYAII